jgi:hypothetical protein
MFGSALLNPFTFLVIQTAITTTTLERATIGKCTIDFLRQRTSLERLLLRRRKIFRTSSSKASTGGKKVKALILR